MYNDIEKFLMIIKNIDEINYRNFSLFNPELKYIHNIKIFNSLSIQNVLRKSDEENTYFLAIKCIELKEEYRSQFLFRKTLEILESKNIPIFVDDIINEKLFTFLANRGYKKIIHDSTHGQKKSMYKQPKKIN